MDAHIFFFQFIFKNIWTGGDILEYIADEGEQVK
jgi:hypothetical protein